MLHLNTTDDPSLLDSLTTEILQHDELPLIMKAQDRRNGAIPPRDRLMETQPQNTLNATVIPIDWATMIKIFKSLINDLLSCRRIIEVKQMASNSIFILYFSKKLWKNRSHLSLKIPWLESYDGFSDPFDYLESFIVI